MAKSQSWAGVALNSALSSTAIRLIGLGTGIVVARLLGPEGRGILANVLTWTTLIAAIVQLPMAEAIVSTSATHPNKAVLRAAFRLSLAILVLTFVPAIWILLWLLSDLPDLPVAVVVAYALAYFVAQSLGQVYRGHFQVERQFTTIQIYTVLQPLLYFVFLLALAVAPTLATVPAVILMLTASKIVTGVVRVIVNGSPFLGMGNDDDAEKDGDGDAARQSGLHWIKTVGRVAAMFHLTKIAQKIGDQGDRLLVVSLMSAFDAGLFFVALTFASVIPGMLNTAVKLLALPALVSLEGPRKQQVAFKLMSVTWLMGLAGVGATLILAPNLLTLLFGADFVGTVGFAMALAGVLALRNLRVGLMEMLKSYVVTLSLSLAPIVLLVSLGFGAALFFPAFGAYGIILALAVAELCTILFLSWQVRGFAPEVARGGWIIPKWKEIVDIFQALRVSLSQRLRR